MSAPDGPKPMRDDGLLDDLAFLRRSAKTRERAARRALRRFAGQARDARAPDLDQQPGKK